MQDSRKRRARSFLIFVCTCLRGIRTPTHRGLTTIVADCAKDLLLASTKANNCTDNHFPLAIYAGKNIRTRCKVQGYALFVHSTHAFILNQDAVLCSLIRFLTRRQRLFLFLQPFQQRPIGRVGLSAQGNRCQGRHSEGEFFLKLKIRNVKPKGVFNRVTQHRHSN